MNGICWFSLFIMKDYVKLQSYLYSEICLTCFAINLFCWFFQWDGGPLYHPPFSLVQWRSVFLTSFWMISLHSITLVIKLTPLLMFFFLCFWMLVKTSWYWSFNFENFSPCQCIFLFCDANSHILLLCRCFKIV